MVEIASIKGFLGLDKAIKPDKTHEQKRPLWPLRKCANEDVYSFLMSLKRPGGTSRFVWSRNRISATLLRWSGSKASDITRLTLGQLQQAIQYQEFQIRQPKTGEVRLIILCKKAVIDLKAIQLDISEVFGHDFNKPLASTNLSNNLLTKARWLKSLNDFIKPAQNHFQLVLNTHSFRINYINNLLCSLPLQGATNNIGLSHTNTTARYNRHAFDIENMRRSIEKMGWIAFSVYLYRQNGVVISYFCFFLYSLNPNL